MFSNWNEKEAFHEILENKLAKKTKSIAMWSANSKCEFANCKEDLKIMIETNERLDHNYLFLEI